MCPDMHLERAHGLVLFATILATEIVVLVSDYLEGLLLWRLRRRRAKFAAGQVMLTGAVCVSAQVERGR